MSRLELKSLTALRGRVRRWWRAVLLRLGAPWILTFSGVHGTTRSSADDIRRRGFDYQKLKPERMFGPGFYMYRSGEPGEMWAKEWGEYKVRKLAKLGMHGEVPCVLHIDFCYSAYEFISWTEDDELDLEKKLNKEKAENPAFRPNRHTQNQWRLRAVSDMAHGTLQKYPVILADFPLPPHRSDHGKKRHPGCVVKDLALLPAPSCTQAGVC